MGAHSMQTTTVGMEPKFVDSNSVILLMPNGRFGTRRLAAQEVPWDRFLCTKFPEISRFLFPKEDDVLIDYMKEDCFSIETPWYMSVIPMVLVNGCEGSGTMRNTFVPSYDPRVIIANIRHLLDGEPLEPMNPWYHNFKGKIEETARTKSGIMYRVSGFIEEIDAWGAGKGRDEDAMLKITELPFRQSIQCYKFLLESLVFPDDADERFIKEIKDYSTNDDVHFEVILSKRNLNLAKRQGLLKKFKLTETLRTADMNLFDGNKFTNYQSPQKILEDFVKLRLMCYKQRKERYLEIYQAELEKLENQINFISGVMKGEIDLFKRKKAEVVDELSKRKFMPIPKNKSVKSAVGATEANKETGDSEEQEENTENPATNAPQLSDYDYLFSLTCGSFTDEKLKELRDYCQEVHKQNEELRDLTEESLWRKDLAALEEALDTYMPMQEKDKRDEEEASGRGVPAEKHCRKNRNVTKAKPVIETVSSSVAGVVETENRPQPAKAKGRPAGAAKKVNSAVMGTSDAPEAAGATKKRGRPAKQTTTTSTAAAEGMVDSVPEKEASRMRPSHGCL